MGGFDVNQHEVEGQTIVDPADLAAPTSPDDHSQSVGVRARMPGIMGFSPRATWLLFGIVAVIAFLVPYGFGWIKLGGGSSASTNPPPLPLSAQQKGQALPTPDSNISEISQIANSAPQGLPSQKGLPPLNTTQQNGKQGSVGTLSSEQTTNQSGQDALDAALNQGSQISTNSTTGQTFDTSGPNVSTDNPNFSGAVVPNPGPSGDMYTNTAMQTAMQNAVSVAQTRQANEAAARKASFVIADQQQQGSGVVQTGNDLQRSAGSPIVNSTGALQLPISSSNSGSSGYGGGAGPAGSAGDSTVAQQQQRITFANGQGGPPAYLDSQELNPVSKYELWAGSIIPAQLDTGINTDMPGPVVAHVVRDVYDSKYGQYLLIPKGSRLIGRYNSFVSTGQARVQVVWDRLIWPDGRFIALQGQAGAEPEGNAGLYADVNDHRGTILTASIFTGLLAAGSQILSGGGGGYYTTNANGQIVFNSVGQQVAQTGQDYIQKKLQVPPELTVPIGKQFDVLLDRSIVLTPWKFQP